MKRLLVCALAVALLMAAALAFYQRRAGSELPVALTPADWPQWRGQNRDDLALETGLLRAWPPGGPKLLWLSRDAGLGYSGPAIVGDRLFIAGADEHKESLMAFDR